MSNIWLSSDEHYNHIKILAHLQRPFANITEMNSELIRRHNSVVAKKDQVYHLGDFAWNNQHKQFLRQLNGHHFLIKGNHEGKVPTDSGFIWVKDTFQLKHDNLLIWLSHYAHRVWPQSHYGSLHCHGHSHGKLEQVGRSLDVGVDAWDFFPVSLFTIKERLGVEGPIC